MLTAAILLAVDAETGYCFDINIPTLQRVPERIILLISAITDNTVCCHGNQESVVSMAATQQTADGSICTKTPRKRFLY